MLGPHRQHLMECPQSSEVDTINLTVQMVSLSPEKLSAMAKGREGQTEFGRRPGMAMKC